MSLQDKLCHCHSQGMETSYLCVINTVLLCLCLLNSNTPLIRHFIVQARFLVHRGDNHAVESSSLNSGVALCGRLGFTEFKERALKQMLAKMVPEFTVRRRHTSRPDGLSRRPEGVGRRVGSSATHGPTSQVGVGSCGTAFTL